MQYDIIIVGGGVAGLSAALYAARAGQKTLVIEKNIEGGQILSTPRIDNYPALAEVSGYELVQNIAAQAKSAGASTVYDNIVGYNLAAENKTLTGVISEYSAKSVIICVGLVNNTLGLKSEAELVGSGVSYCATCDGAFFKDKTVMVAGSGKTARFDVEYLSQIAKKVYVVGLEGEQVSGGNIEFIENASVTKLSGMPLKSVSVLANGKNSDIEVDGLFVATGRRAATSHLAGIVELDPKGYIITDEDMATNVQGVFAAGDVRKKSLRQLVTAAADGAIAATSAIRYLKRLKKADK